MLGLQNEREWKVFCDKVLLQPALAAEERFSTNAKRSAQRQELSTRILQAFAALTAEQVAQRLEEAGIANAQVNTMEEVWAHPQLKARGRWTEVDTPAGPVPALVPPGSWQHGPARMDAVPALGQHTNAILEALGYSATQIAVLRAEAAI
jgi:crotonobetainyl-CoA:carnitine CoA-transferase CaiB-like acyl-CoA transferase